ncbi:MAG: ROK family protein [Enhygromyxa sp.]
MDLGATTLRARAGVGAEWSERRVALGDRSGAEGLDLLCDTIIELARSLGSRPAALTMSAAATVDVDGRILRWPNRPDWAGLPLRSRLSDTLDCPIMIDDDGNLAALSEAELAGVEDLVYLGVGTGVGGGVVLGGRLLRGHTGRAGEFGHLRVSDDGPPCTCGRLGCLQAYACGPAVLSRAFPGRPDARAEHLLTALNDRDPRASAAIDAAALALARVIADLGELFDPARVSVGGGFADAVPPLLARTREHLPGFVRAGSRVPPIFSAAAGPDSSLDGAALLAQRAAASATRRSAS